ncbi:hypothetical protein MPSEU_000233800 [Mayamaea pseudoterrestris]|nr:hypothetical protein MPSEU_000233800 [Mayamaea pseudoterrestris]
MSMEIVDKPTKTKGEELFLVHLTRYQQPSPEDFDRDGEGSCSRKERSMSAGEELWEIHCRRSRNRAEEEEEDEQQDEEQDVQPSSATVKKRRTVKNATATVVTPGTQCGPTRNLSLRNREVAIA